MKQRNGERIERRKTSPELNMLDTGRARGGKGRSARGCVSLLSRLVAVSAILMVVVLGLR